MSGADIRRSRAPAILALLAVATLIALVLHIGIGSTNFYSPADVVRELLHGPTGSTNANNVVWHVRLTRALGCALVGGLLGAVGSAFQALFRNPLADPYIVGVSSGAAIGAVGAELLGFAGFAGGLGAAGLAFVGGLLSLGLVVGLARRRGAIDVMVLLLAGVVIGTMLAALLTLLILFSGLDTVRLMQALLGDASRLNWSAVGLLASTLAMGAPLLHRQSRALNAFAIGEDTARRLGVDTGRLKAVILIGGTGMASVAVGTVGIIAFVGLVAPHIARGLLGVDWRRSLLGSILVGGLLMLVADALAQRGSSVGVAGIPVGAVTALIGAPSLLILLRKSV